jgi:hypothetical protein
MPTLAGKPLCIELFAGTMSWSRGWLELGGHAVGFDLEHLPHHGPVPKGAELVLQNVNTLHGRQFKNAVLILASPPCQEFSYMAMPFTRGKQIAAALRGEGEFPEKYVGSRTVAELTALFDACFRIQREASEAAGHHIPMVVENVVGAQRWVGPAKAHFGSRYLWGDVWNVNGKIFAGDLNLRCGLRPIGREMIKNQNRNEKYSLTCPPLDASEGVKQGGNWFHDPESMTRKFSSKSPARKAASARIAMIPERLSRYIAECYWPQEKA